MKTKERREQSQCNMTVHVHSFLSFDFLSVLSSLSAHVDEEEGREEKREREMKELSLKSQTVLPVCILCWCRYSQGKQILFTLETTHSLSLAERCISLSRLLRTYTHTHTHSYMHILRCSSSLYLDGGESNELFYLLIQTHTRTCLIVCLFSPAYVQFIMMITQFSIFVYLSVQWAGKN